MDLHARQRDTDTQALKEGQTVTETFTATVTDDFGATATQVVTHHHHRHQRFAGDHHRVRPERSAP